MEVIARQEKLRNKMHREMKKIAQKSRLKIAVKIAYIGIETIAKFHSNCVDVNKLKNKNKISKIDLEVVYF